VLDGWVKGSIGLGKLMAGKEGEAAQETFLSGFNAVYLLSDQSDRFRVNAKHTCTDFSMTNEQGLLFGINISISP